MNGNVTEGFIQVPIYPVLNGEVEVALTRCQSDKNLIEYLNPGQNRSQILYIKKSNVCIDI